MRDEEEHGLQGERLRHVLLIYREMIPSIRLCGHCQMEYLAQQGKVDYRAVQVMKLKGGDLNWADVVLLGRLDSWYEFRLTKRLHESGRYLIYLIDDDLLNIPLEISSAVHYGRKEIQGYIRSMMEMSDAILSPSALLLEKYAVNGRQAIRIEEPAIDPVPYRPHDPGKPVKIGFAGSIDRTGDIEHILKEALLQIKREYGERVEFAFFGGIPSFAKELDARCIPYCDDYDEYREKLNSLEWDIGLAPMPDTPFHACKHYNKFVEYAAAGVVGVFSDVMPYSRLREKGFEAQLVVNHAKAWTDALSSLIESAEREALRQKLCTLSVEEFSVEKTAQALFAQMHAHKTGRALREVNWRLGWMKLRNLIRRTGYVIRKYKWHAVPLAVDKMCKRIGVEGK